MGREGERVQPDAAGQAHPLRSRPTNYFIERIPYQGLGANGYGRKIDEWKQLQAEGWDVTVLDCRTYGMAFGYLP